MEDNFSMDGGGVDGEDGRWSSGSNVSELPLLTSCSAAQGWGPLF